MGALSKPDEFHLNLLVRTCTLSVPGTSKDNDSENRAPTGDRYLGEPCYKAAFSTYHFSNLNDSEQEETHHVVTGVQEGISYCSPGISSGKQKARSTSQPHFRSENIPATIEAD